MLQGEYSVPKMMLEESLQTEIEDNEIDGDRWTDVVWSVVREYLRNASLHGYRYMTEPKRHWIERVVWLVVHIMAVWGVVVIISDVWWEFLTSPTVTTVDSTNFPIWKVPFPAVAVCNLNKISLRAAKKMARFMYTGVLLFYLYTTASHKSEKTKVNESEVLHLLRYLGRLYDHDIDGRANFLPLHKLLQRTFDEAYNVTAIMHELNPSCDELLVRCSWAGRNETCSTLFVMRKTMEGYCCAFNYLRLFDDFVSGAESSSYDWKKHKTDGRRGSMFGSRLGLSVVVNPNPIDYYYPLISSYGSKVLVFGPHDYPDTPSGGLVEKLVPLHSEVFFRLEATSVASTEGVRSFPVARRGCLFTSELQDLFAGYYSYSECLMNCRIRSITRLCRCVPYYFPARASTRECHMMDIECLSRYREKWWTLRPTQAVPGLEAERESSISCEECLPSCADTAYHVQTTSAPLSDPHFASSFLLENVTLVNHSIFHLFFGSFDSSRLKQDALYYWYELLSNFGGICGLFVGFSLISIVEFAYFFTVRLFLAFRARERRRLATLAAVGAAAAGRAPARAKDHLSGDFYWREVRPRY